MSLLERPLTNQILAACVTVHRELGPGLLESAYEHSLMIEFEKRGLDFDQQLPLPVSYSGVEIPNAFRIDFLVEKKVVLELKAVSEVTRLHTTQLLTYLRFSRIRVGLLVNFNVVNLGDGITRRVL